MRNLLLELALPSTDAAALAQAGIAALIFGYGLWRVRNHPDLSIFVLGLATITFAWFALRTLH